MTMGEENNIFGECKIGFMSEGKFCELGAIVEDNTEWEAEEVKDIDSLKVREKMLSAQLEIGAMSVDLADNPDLPKFIGADYNNGETYCSVSIMGETIINKPKSLKYPNKKRARRIWKKWKRRFGCRPTSMMLFPKARIGVDLSKDMGAVRISGVANE